MASTDRLLLKRRIQDIVLSAFPSFMIRNMWIDMMRVNIEFEQLYDADVRTYICSTIRLFTDGASDEFGEDEEDWEFSIPGKIVYTIPLGAWG